MVDPVLGELALPARGLLRGTVVDLVDETRVLVRVAVGGSESVIVAERLCTSEVPVRFGHGDAVFCWAEGGDPERLLVLGRIGVAASTTPAAAPIPDELVLEARQSLTLRVGDGSITIREDGKILIKGKDLVSHAQRMNRIKGGAVSIN